MNKEKWIVFVATLLLIAGAAVVLVRFKAKERLGQPGVKTSELKGSQCLRVELPETVAGFESEAIETPAIVTNTLPKDTSYGQRRYKSPDGFQGLVNVVLMGTDRTSLHKPQFCLLGDGWTIDNTEITSIPIERPHPNELPVIKLTTTKQFLVNGKPVTARGIYIYWFVADGALSADPKGVERMWWMAKHRLRTGELQRWAYVTYFAYCRPGGEEATYKRLKELIAATVPEFQLVTTTTRTAQISAVGNQLPK